MTRVYPFSCSLEWEPPSYCSVPPQCHTSTMLLGDTHPILLIISVVMQAQRCCREHGAVVWSWKGKVAFLPRDFQYGGTKLSRLSHHTGGATESWSMADTLVRGFTKRQPLKILASVNEKASFLFCNNVLFRGKWVKMADPTLRGNTHFSIIAPYQSSITHYLDLSCMYECMYVYIFKGESLTMF